MGMTEAPGSPREQAERWFARLMAPDCSAAERADFERWRGQSPAHAAAYSATERLLAGVDELAATDPRMQALLREAHQLGDRSAAGHEARSRGWLRPLALAASVLVAVAGTWLAVDVLRRAPEPVQYATTAERRTIALEDGSTVELDVASRFSASFTEQRRDIELQDGRAVFEVAPDKSRPFTVRAGDGAVTAIGTRFQVERERDQVTVTLAEGIVSVSRENASGSATQETRLQPGEQLVWSGASDWSRRQADIEAGLSWSRGRLVFRNTPLAEVVAQVNRYSPRKLVLVDPALAELPVHGNFVAGDASKVASALEAVLPLQADAGDSEIRLSRRH